VRQRSAPAKNGIPKVLNKKRNCHSAGAILHSLNLGSGTFGRHHRHRNLSPRSNSKNSSAGGSGGGARAKTATFEVKLSRAAKPRIYVAKINIINDLM
jgi:hypothetical protein